MQCYSSLHNNTSQNELVYVHVLNEKVVRLEVAVDDLTLMNALDNAHQLDGEQNLQYFSFYSRCRNSFDGIGQFLRNKIV